MAVQVAADLGRWISEAGNAKRNVATAPRSSPLQSDGGAPSDGAIGVGFRKRFGDEARQLLHGLTTDQLGNVVIIGDFWGSIDFGGSKLTSVGDRDVFVAKFDCNGNHVWSERYGDMSEQVGVDLGADSGGNIFLTSAFFGTLDFGGGPLVSHGRYNVALAKLNKAGQHLWSRSFGDDKYHVPECLAVPPSGRVVVAGRFQGAIDFGGGRIESKSALDRHFCGCSPRRRVHIYGASASEGLTNSKRGRSPSTRTIVSL